MITNGIYIYHDAVYIWIYCKFSVWLRRICCYRYSLALYISLCLQLLDLLSGMNKQIITKEKILFKKVYYIYIVYKF